MRTIKSLTAFLLLVSSSFAQTAQLRGVEMSDIDKGVDACNDFFEYSNGQWRKNNPIPASMPRWSRRWQAGETSKDKLKAIVDELSSGHYQKGSVEQITGDYYAACIDESQANQLGSKPIRPLMAELDAIKTRADVQRMIIRLQDFGIAAPFAFGSGQDSHEPSNVIAQVYAGGLGLPDRDYYLKPDDQFVDNRAKYSEHVNRMFVLFGSDQTQANAIADSTIAFESRLAKASLDNVALRDPKATNNKMSFANLQKLAPDFDWAAYYKHFNVKPGDVNVSEPKFLTEFNDILAKTPISEWKSYLKWQFLNFASGNLSEPFVAANYIFFGAYLNGSKEIKPRWKRCVESADALIGEALGKKYVEKYFPAASKARMQELVKNLLAAMGETIRGLDWMSPETKKRALEKLATFRPKIGYPDKWKDYSRLPISRASYWNNLVAAIKFNIDDDHSTIGKGVDRDRWGMTPPTSDAQYNPLLNDITFPAGILQSPAFSNDVNDAVNYGSIGVVIGHEISHGFDDQGAQYDAQGKLNNWWTAEDYKKFQARTECVANQFDNFFIEPGLHHNGHLVLGESIADLAGAKLAYRALEISRRDKPPLPAVDGLTPDQQFFVAWGQFRGDAVRPEFARRMIQGDPHPVAKYRVIGPLSNLPEFQKAFGCRDDSLMVRPMNQRCEIW
ncbi:MAG: M13 family metallopeptidase [Acidobacteriota bacterium]